MGHEDPGGESLPLLRTSPGQGQTVEQNGCQYAHLADQESYGKLGIILQAAFRPNGKRGNRQSAAEDERVKSPMASQGKGRFVGSAGTKKSYGVNRGQGPGQCTERN